MPCRGALSLTCGCVVRRHGCDSVVDKYRSADLFYSEGEIHMRMHESQYKGQRVVTRVFQGSGASRVKISVTPLVAQYSPDIREGVNYPVSFDEGTGTLFIDISEPGSDR